MRKALISIALLGLIVMPSVVLAAREAPLPPIDGKAIKLSSVETFVANIMDSLITIVSFLVVGAFVYAGFLMVTAGEDSGKFEKGKTVLKQAALGALVIFGVGLIVNTISDFAQDPEAIVR
jgi:Mn2+/Fe2+ NRAMP family transporter